MTPQRPRVGVIGLGRMGTPVARRLVSAGFEVLANDADPSRLSDVEGVVPIESPREVAERSDVVITFLPSSTIVEAVFGEAATGLLAGARPGLVFLDMGSSHPRSTLSIGEQVISKGAALVDAPVSGGVARAETGELAVMVGGDPETISVVMPVLRVLGTTITRTGPLGSAHVMKALNNLLSAAGLAAAVETLLIGKHYGLEPATMLDVLNASTGMNHATLHKIAQRVFSRTFDAGFPLGLMVKDLEIAATLAAGLETPPSVSREVVDLWRRAGEALGPDVDHTEIAVWLEQCSGETLRV